MSTFTADFMAPHEEFYTPSTPFQQPETLPFDLGSQPNGINAGFDAEALQGRLNPDKHAALTR